MEQINIYGTNLDLTVVNTPAFIVQEKALKRNLAILNSVQERTGVKILLALKGFAMFHTFPLLSKTLNGICASSPHEARLGQEHFCKEVHSFAAAYSESDIDELIKYSDHIVFNSFSQWQRFRAVIQEKAAHIQCGIRVNPEHSETDVEIYDPCAPRSRLGVTINQFDESLLNGISGLHFHTLCEKGADAFSRTLKVFEEKFSKYLPELKWVNFGGGHHISQENYDVDLLCDTLNAFKQKYNLEMYMEPGEAVALNAGVLVAEVLDVVHNQVDIAILDTSAAAHMPDVIEMPYRPEIVNGAQSNEKEHNYRLAGLSCLAGDIIGDYSFDAPLQAGMKLAFKDMAHYSMVKTNTFNGLQLPSIYYQTSDEKLHIIRQFGYDDFKNRLS